MSKNKEWKKYIGDILILFALGIIIFTIIASRELNNLDEVWIFNTARCVANGLLPYRDFNIVTTPGLPLICGLILKIFGTEMFLMRIMATIINALIIFIIYKIFRLLEINTGVSLLLTSFILNSYIKFLCIDYNVMILFIALIALYIEIKNYKNETNIFKINIKRELLLGIFVGTSILMKQTTGLCFSIAFIGYKLLLVKNKGEFKCFIKIAIARLIGVILPIIILLSYLKINNITEEFIDYAILGIKEFGNYISYMRLIRSEYFLWAILAPLVFIILLFNGIKRKDTTSIIIFSYSISAFVVVYPISDPIHFLIASTIDFIGLIYILKRIYENKIMNSIGYKIKIFINEFCKNIFIVFIVSSVLISCIKLWNLNLNQYTELTNFKYIPVSSRVVQEIKSVDKYMKESKKITYIVEARAPLYMIPLDRYNKDYDMFLIGNMGVNASNRIINDLKDNEDLNLLLFKGNMNWQTPVDIIEYIKQNYKKIGEIGNFYIYSLENDE